MLVGLVVLAIIALVDATGAYDGDGDGIIEVGENETRELARAAPIFPAQPVFGPGPGTALGDITFRAFTMASTETLR